MKKIDIVKAVGELALCVGTETIVQKTIWKNVGKVNPVSMACVFLTTTVAVDKATDILAEHLNNKIDSVVEGFETAVANARIKLSNELNKASPYVVNEEVSDDG